MFFIIKELVRFKYLLYTLVNRDITKKYRRSFLGIIWSLLNPMMMMFITAMVFSTLFRFEIRNYALYLLIGQVVFTFYVESTVFAMNSILENSALLKKIYVPKFLFPVARILSSCMNFVFTLPAIFIIMLVTDAPFGGQTLLFVLPLVLMLLFCMGVGMILSACMVYFRDLGHIYGILITILSYATPIFYPASIVPEKFQFLLLCNPLYYFVSMFRVILYDGCLPSAELVAICSGLAATALFIGFTVFGRLENKFINYI